MWIMHITIININIIFKQRHISYVGVTNMSPTCWMSVGDIDITDIMPLFNNDLNINSGFFVMSNTRLMW